MYDSTRMFQSQRMNDFSDAIIDKVIWLHHVQLTQYVATYVVGDKPLLTSFLIGGYVAHNPELAQVMMSLAQNWTRVGRRMYTQWFCFYIPVQPKLVSY